MKYIKTFFVVCSVCFLEIKATDICLPEKTYKNLYDSSDYVIPMDKEELLARVDAYFNLLSLSYKEYEYSSLWDVDTALQKEFSSLDSLFEIVIFELDKLPSKDSSTFLLTSLLLKKGLSECDALAFSQTLFFAFTQAEQLSIYEYFHNKNKFFYVSDKIKYWSDASLQSSSICASEIILLNDDKEYCRLTQNKKFIEIMPAIADICSLHISSEKSPSGEDIIQINSTPYRIATRADGSKVLRRFQ